MGKRSSSVNVGQESQSSCLPNHPVHPKPRATPKPRPRATPRQSPRQSPRQRASQPRPRQSGEPSARQRPPQQQQLLPTPPTVLLLEGSAHPPPPRLETMPPMESRCLAIRVLFPHRAPPLLPVLLPLPHQWHWRSSPP